MIVKKANYIFTLVIVLSAFKKILSKYVYNSSFMFFNILLLCLKGYSETLIRIIRQLKAPFLSYADFESILKFKVKSIKLMNLDKSQSHILITCK